MYLSKIELRRNITPNDIVSLYGWDGYQIHKMVWNLFSDGPDRKRDFLYRHETARGTPIFYTVSSRKPYDQDNLWNIKVKEYHPKINKMEHLAFSLRVNPIVSKRDENNRQHRHDVVMEAKNQIHFKGLPQKERPHLATLVQEAGLAWLKSRENNHGFCVTNDYINPGVRVDGYYQYKFHKENGGKGIKFSTLDFNGILMVTDPNAFIQKALFGGVGPAKGFGCGLMLVRRI